MSEKVTPYSVLEQSHYYQTFLPLCPDDFNEIGFDIFKNLCRQIGQILSVKNFQKIPEGREHKEKLLNKK